MSANRRARMAVTGFIVVGWLTLGSGVEAWASCEDSVQHLLTLALAALDHLSDPETLDEVFLAKGSGIISRMTGSFRAWRDYVSQRNPRLVVWEDTTKNVALIALEGLERRGLLGRGTVQDLMPAAVPSLFPPRMVDTKSFATAKLRALKDLVAAAMQTSGCR